MSWYDRSLKSQEVTYWAPAAPDGYGGTGFDSPTLLDAIVQDREERFYDEQGGEKRSDTAMHLSQSVEQGGYIAIGDQTGTSDPTTLTDAFEVTETRQQKGLTNRSPTVYIALLQKASRPV